MLMRPREVVCCEAEGRCCIYGMELGHMKVRDEPKAHATRWHGRPVALPHRSGLQSQAGDGVATWNHQKVDRKRPTVYRVAV